MATRLRWHTGHVALSALGVPRGAIGGDDDGGDAVALAMVLLAFTFARTLMEDEDEEDEEDEDEEEEEEDDPLLAVALRAVPLARIFKGGDKEDFEDVCRLDSLPLSTVASLARACRSASMATSS